MNSYAELQALLLDLPSLVHERGEEPCYQALDSQLRALTAARQSLSAAEDECEAARFRGLLGPMIHESTFCRYVFEKPRGYAGDYITQEMVWLGRTRGGPHRYAGATERGCLINALTLDMDNCRANEERIYRLRALLESAGPRIMSVASGCGIEFWELPDSRLTNRDILLLDKDADALAHARKQLATRTHWNVTYNVENVLKFALRDAGADRHSRDFVYAFGLMDYFPLPTGQQIVRGLWQYVAPAGSLVITNAHPQNPTRVWMEYAGQWFLNYKDESTVRALANGLVGVTEISYTLDSYGIYQYLRINA